MCLFEIIQCHRSKNDGVPYSFSVQDRAMPIQDKRVVIIIQARMTSERLPGKVMLPLNGRSILQYQLERLDDCENVDAIGVATVDDPTCAPIIELCDQLNIHVTGGSEDNVLSRYVKCGAEMKADVVVRITSDCPLIDPALVDMTIEEFFASCSDYCAMDIPTSYSRGLDCEVVHFSSLIHANEVSVDPQEKEHVMPYIHRRPDEYKVRYIKGDKKYGGDRYCVDTPEDFEVVTKIADAFKDHDAFGFQDIWKFLRANPDVAALNQHIEQKKLAEKLIR